MKAAMIVPSVAALALVGCGDDGSSSGGTGTMSGTGATPGSGGAGAMYGSNDPECVRICESPCVGECLDESAAFTACITP